MLCSWYPNRVQPTNGNFVERHLRSIEESVRITVLQVEHDSALAAGQVEWRHTPRGGAEVWTVYFGSEARRAVRLLTRMRLFQQAFLRLRQSVFFDLVHVHVAMPGVLLARFWWARYGLPFVVSVHSSGFLPISPKRYPWWQRRLLVQAANAAKVVCPVSASLATAWREDGLKAVIEVVPNVVDTSIFCPAMAPTLATNPLRLFHLSNFHPEAKNVAGLLRVARRLVDDGFPFRLTIAGDGDLEVVMAYSQALALPTDQVVLKGELTETEVADHMRSHHATVLFSNYETQGVTLLEAQCCGRPAIATRVGGIPETVDASWKGVLVAAGNEVALTEAIQNFDTAAFANQAERIARAAAERFGEEAVRRRLLAVYRLALKRGN